MHRARGAAGKPPAFEHVEDRNSVQTPDRNNRPAALPGGGLTVPLTIIVMPPG